MLNNLDKDTRERLKSGDIKFLKEVLTADYDRQRTFLVNCPEDIFLIEQGKARVLTQIIELLP